MRRAEYAAGMEMMKTSYSIFARKPKIKESLECLWVETG
jgi:hypothetical protein